MNYYKILEVDKDASPEVIDKAYRTLVKKYHPDLQESNMKQKAEEKIKLINEAYKVLSNPDSRSSYDEILKQKEFSEEDYNRISKENEQLHNEIEDLKNKEINTYSNINNPYQPNHSLQDDASHSQHINQLEYENELEQARQKAYHDAYIQDLKNRGYKIRYKKTIKDYFKNFLALVITIAILFILWQIPFIQNFFKNMYNENPILQAIINLFI